MPGLPCGGGDGLVCEGPEEWEGRVTWPIGNRPKILNFFLLNISKRVPHTAFIRAWPLSAGYSAYVWPGPRDSDRGPRNPVWEGSSIPVGAGAPAPLTRPWCRRWLVRAGVCCFPLRSESWSPAGRGGAPRPASHSVLIQHTGRAAEPPLSHGTLHGRLSPGASTATQHRMRF